MINHFVVLYMVYTLEVPYVYICDKIVRARH
ncbi:hypothetical protein SAMN05216379_11079 [Nitrosomonas eutropha]|nr:hypothetical protein SAMN05216379_11079 [Nitrosomonas eutropha]